LLLQPSLKNSNRQFPNTTRQANRNFTINIKTGLIHHKRYFFYLGTTINFVPSTTQFPTRRLGPTYIRYSDFNLHFQNLELFLKPVIPRLTRSIKSPVIAGLTRNPLIIFSFFQDIPHQARDDSK
jgi:hypothetical protein